jgi:RNA-directed DNA polymerase
MTRLLGPRCSTLNEDKTRTVHLDEGPDFLGFSICRYSGKLLIRPKQRGHQMDPAEATRRAASLRGSNAADCRLRSTQSFVDLTQQGPQPFAR